MCKKKLKKLLLPLFIMMTLVFTLLLFHNQVELMDAVDVLKGQKEQLQLISEIMDGCDSAITLYITGDIDMRQLSDEIYIDYNTSLILQKEYEQYLESSHIRPGSNTSETEAAFQGLSDMYSHLIELFASLDQLLSSGSTADEVSYIYMGYRQILSSDLVPYMNYHNR